MPTVCRKSSQDQVEFQQSSTRRVVADFEGGQITSDGGALLVRQVAKYTHILGDLADCFIDHRRAEQTRHSIQELVGQRVLGIACGYEDLNDHDQLRDDPLWRLLAGKANPTQQPALAKAH